MMPAETRRSMYLVGIIVVAAVVDVCCCCCGEVRPLLGVVERGDVVVVNMAEVDVDDESMRRRSSCDDSR